MRSTGSTSLACLTLALAACTTVTRVKGPDGTDHWYAVSCGGGKYNCYQAAADQCPRGYILADSSGGAVATSNFVGYQGDMLIRCKAGGAGAQHTPPPAARREQPEEQSAAQTVPEKDYAQCNALYGHVDDTVALWVEWFHGTPANALPTREAFNAACIELDEDVQLCLAATYARNHHDACLAKLESLSKPSRAELDGLLTAPSVSAARPSP